VSFFPRLFHVCHNLKPELNRSQMHMFIFFFTGIHELFSMLYEDKCSMADSCWLKALGGMLLALSSEGDIIYLTENVTQQLGFHQVKMKLFHFSLKLSSFDLVNFAIVGFDWEKRFRLLPSVRSQRTP
jgi:hypothetical protein